VLSTYWGFDTLRPLQREAIQASLDGKDSLVILPTGGGKSLCYQVPPLITGELCVVASPLIALMKDQVDGLALSGYPAAAIHSGMDSGAVMDVRRRVQSGEVKLLLAAPERLLTESFLAFLAKVGVGSFAIDEAHCISQWGHDFRPEYRRLAELRDVFPGVPIHAYTATATPRVRDDIVRQLGLENGVTLTGVFDRPNLTYRILPRVSADDQVEEVLRRHEGRAAIVYCIARKECERLAEVLTKRGIRARAYHAGMSPADRHDVQEDFANELLNVVVATVAFGMGIDRSDVRCVVHASMPKSVEHYQQETGRAGRDGLPSECVLLYSGADVQRWKGLMERSAAESEVEVDPEALQAQLELLNHMQRLCVSARCRHRALSEYFGQRYTPPAPPPSSSETSASPRSSPDLVERGDAEGAESAGEGKGVDDGGCRACDVCLHELEEVEGSTVVAQKIVSCVARMVYQAEDGPRGFGVAHVVDVLRGSRAEKVAQRGHDRLSTFGLLAGHDKAELAALTNQLVDGGFLARTPGEFPTLVPGPRARALLKGELAAHLYRPRVSETAAAAASRGRAAAGEGPPLAPEERGLFDALREVRKRVALELGVPPYVVFGDATLEEMARVRPGTLVSLANVRGVGQAKLAQFGERFVRAVADHCHASGMALDAAVGSRPRSAVAKERRRIDPDRPVKSLSDAKQAAFKMYERGASIEEVAAETGKSPRTTAEYLAEYIERFKPGSVAPWVSEPKYRKIAEAADKVGSQFLGPIYRALGGGEEGPGEATYDEIRVVLSHRAAVR
jgi:ATP-dependent DNA helicase RecQ